MTSGLTATSALQWKTKVAKDHPLLSTLGVLAILIAFTFSFSIGNNANFVLILLALLGVVFCIFFALVPTPSGARCLLGLFFAILWVSLLLDMPFELRRLINRLLARPPATVSNPRPAPPEVAASSPATVAASSSPRVVYRSLPFSMPSASVNVGCGTTATTSVTFPMPTDGELESASARWVDTRNISSATQQVSTVGSNVVATGTIVGLNFQVLPLGIRNCAGGGQGTLELTGSYRVPSR